MSLDREFDTKNYHSETFISENSQTESELDYVLKNRDIYLKIEKLSGYSPVAPGENMHSTYRRDCMRNQGHEDGQITDEEVELRRFDGIIYREYLDPGYTVPKMDPLIKTDINEPPFDSRIPGTVIYTEPGERLFIHVLNDDDQPHSMHVHGLKYGIDSDGSWPFGVSDAEGRRSDEICPGDNWTYIFDITEDTIGAWPFHDHHMNVMENVNRGLFGGIVVRNPRSKKPHYEVPLFFHRLSGPRNSSLFDSGTLTPGQSFSRSFPNQGIYEYFCRFHPMRGRVRVISGESPQATINIMDGPSRFDPDEVVIGLNGSVTWQHQGIMPHTATEFGSVGMESVALNGRTFVGNTPTIVVKSGKRLRWYVFNLDLGMVWHNFHVHGQRWLVGKESADVRSLSPAESFVADTIVPNVINLPKHGLYKDYGKHKKIKIFGDFLVHCHVEPHMMEGMSALLRAVQEIEITEEMQNKLGFNLPVYDGNNECPMVDMTRCVRNTQGEWNTLPNSPIFVVHAALLHTGKVLLFSGTAEVTSPDYPLESRLWDPSTGSFTAQSFDEDLFCSGHAFLSDGRLCVVGGAPFGTIHSTHIFDPVSESWSRGANMNIARWYPTVLTLSDGRILAGSGVYGVSQLEIYDPTADAWQTIIGADREFSELYPSLHLLPTGEIFYSRAGWSVATGSATSRLTFTGLNSGMWTDTGQQVFYEREEGTAVIMIDSAVAPTTAQVIIIGGGVTGTPTTRNPQSCEMIDLTSLTPLSDWSRISDMHFPRTNVNAVVLPDRTVLVIGGQRNGKWSADPQPVLEAEIYDPASNEWTVLAPMQYPRQYHSVAVLLPDGRVMTAGGIDPTLGGTPQRDQRFMEVLSPPYMFRGTRPTLNSTPSQISYGIQFDILTPEASSIESVVLLRPISMTHHTDAGQRYVKLAILARNTNKITIKSPDNGNIAPPGYYMIFIVTTDKIPSVANFIQIL